MRKRMEKLAAKLNNQMVLTETPVNLDEYDGTSYKYFLCWTVTHNIFKAFQTQREVVEFFESAEKNDGFVQTEHGCAKIMF